ncbi:MAG: NUDIX domain-containing protein [Acidimicrobiia bacterium]
MGCRAVRPASTVCVVRDPGHLEVLMVQRTMDANFMPGVWVFPGGAVDDTDASPPAGFGTPPVDAWRVAALREMIEETGIWLTTDGTLERDVTEDAFGAVEASGVSLDLGALFYFANWITPAVFPIGFDTRFFVAVVEDHINGTIDGDELIDMAWVTPQEALKLDGDRRWELAYPTRRTLRLLAGESSSGSLISRLERVGSVPAVQPRLVVTDSEVYLLTPDDEGWEEAGPAQSDPTILDRMTEVLRRGGTVPAEFRHGS